jgi:hypothetical protein
MRWYLRREWMDQEDGTENVMIHYTWTLPGDWPDWARDHNSRMLQDVGGFPRQRKKILAMPGGLPDGRGGWSLEYRFHFFFEVWQHGRNWTTDLESEDIVYRDMDYVDAEGWITNICTYWAVYDWEAPIYSPMEDHRFPKDSEFTSERYYAYWDKDRYHYAKSQMLKEIPTPHYWQTRIWGPRGALIVQQFHIGRMYPPEEKYEAWFGPDGPTAPGGSHWVFQL